MHVLVVDSAVRLDLHVVFNIVHLAVVDPRGWVENMVRIEWIDTNGDWQDASFATKTFRLRPGTSVYDSVLGGINLSRTPATGCRYGPDTISKHFIDPSYSIRLTAHCTTVDLREPQ